MWTGDIYKLRKLKYVKFGFAYQFIEKHFVISFSYKIIHCPGVHFGNSCLRLEKMQIFYRIFFNMSMDNKKASTNIFRITPSQLFIQRGIKKVSQNSQETSMPESL